MVAWRINSMKLSNVGINFRIFIIYYICVATTTQSSYFFSLNYVRALRNAEKVYFSKNGITDWFDFRNNLTDLTINFDLLKSCFSWNISKSLLLILTHV